MWGDFFLLSLSLVGTPHQFLAKCGEVTLVALLHYLDGMRRLADDEAGLLRHTLAAAIDGYEIVVAAAFHI